ncbi:hypothetical protein [Deinococcus budaensis]|uniref:Uncharacterized protein n=1 Tax=Deinococcus budaensis TaxID=1665626 RepID=A0A7W8LQW6_9DEIO|nr:hypothetical protein [Deinococcus budaensis]MBB5235174.1 hypothetical protein [Deinococcus budaensis]
MLSIASLGIVAGTVRAALLEPGKWSLPGLILGAWVPLLPVAVVAAFCLWLARASPGAALGGGVAAALGAAVYSFELLHPKYNQDANIGLGLYMLFGWLFPLSPAFLVGAGLGSLVERRRGLPPSPTALEDAWPLPRLRPWLWPLLPPALVSLAVAVQPFVRLGQARLVDAASLPGLLLAVVFTSGGQLAVSLAPALVVLLVLRGRAARDGTVQPRLAAFWGLCLGLAVTLGLFGFGAGLLGGVGLEVYILLCALPPMLGCGVGWWVGRRGEAAR